MSITYHYKFIGRKLLLGNLVNIPTEVNIDDKWKKIEEIGWVPYSTATMDFIATRDRVIEIGREMLNYHMHNIADMLRKKYPLFHIISRKDLLQLIALGKDIINSIIQTPDLLDYLLTDLQPIDIEFILDPPL
jgi:hypothetical protein